MLFDLRSRGRRRTVQAVYLGLALLMGGGLVLFGVGTGNGNGGLLNAFGGGGSGNQKQGLSAAERSALSATRLHPSDAASWAKLVQARWENANAGNNYDTQTATFTTGGKQELSALAQDWQRYLKLTPKADGDLAILAARAYAQLGNYSGEASAWELQTQANPASPNGYLCLAASAYAAKQTRKGDLAAAKAESLVPKATRFQIKQQLAAAKISPQVAQSC